jgi:hypothetical protein
MIVVEDALPAMHIRLTNLNPIRFLTNFIPISLRYHEVLCSYRRCSLGNCCCRSSSAIGKYCRVVVGCRFSVLSPLFSAVHSPTACTFHVPHSRVPQISVRDGAYGGLDALDPTLSWSDSQRSGDIDLSYGIESAVRPTSDLASLPKSIWGKASTDVAGWRASARADVNAQDLKNADVEVDAANANMDLAVRLTANAGSNFNVKTVEATKGINQNGARITVTPRYNLDTEDRDVVLTYSKDNTNAKLTASADNQSLTISQQVDNNNRIAPTVNNAGDISVEWERRLSDSSSLTANLKPNDSLDVEWKDSAWTASVNMPIDGANVKGVNVGIRRDVEF